MARARNIKPSFFTNDSLAECQPLARLLFAGLWTIADREGRLIDRPKKIKVELLPYDDCDCDKLLADLESKGFLSRYAIGQERFIEVSNFIKHQNPHVKETASTIPAPDKNSAIPVLNVPLPLTPTPYTDSPIPITLPPIPKGYSSGFEDWWKIFPASGGSKAEASQLYEKAIKQGVEHGFLQQRATDYVEYLNRGGDGGRACHATTYLGKQKRFETDYKQLGHNTGKPTGTARTQMGSRQEQADHAVQNVLKSLGLANQTQTANTSAKFISGDSIRTPAPAMLLDARPVREGH